MEKSSENVWAKEQSVQLGSFVPNDGSAAATASSCTLRLLTGLPQNGRSFMLQTFTPSLTMNPIARGKISVCFPPLLFFAPPPLSLPSRLLPIFNPPYTPPHYPTYSAYTTCHRRRKRKEMAIRATGVACVGSPARVHFFSFPSISYISFSFFFFEDARQKKTRHPSCAGFETTDRFDYQLLVSYRSFFEFFPL